MVRANALTITSAISLASMFSSLCISFLFGQKYFSLTTSHAKTIAKLLKQQNQKFTAKKEILVA
jgi:hypothetical protein